MSGKVVFVTGCTAGGIGHAVAADFAARGCKVYATARKVSSMKGLAEAGCSLLPLDVTDPKTIFAAVEQVLQESGRIDILINNAGLGGRGPVCDYEIAQAKRVFDVNYFGTMAVCQAIVPRMLERRTGVVVNIGSALGLVTLPFTGVYSGSKRAVRGLTDALRRECYGSGVRVVYCAPGWVKSNISDSGAASNLNQINMKGPWAACAKHVVEDLFAHEAAHAVTPAQFAKDFCSMALQSSPPAFWTNSLQDGWFCVLMERFAPTFILDFFMSRRCDIHKAFGSRTPAPMGIM